MVVPLPHLRQASRVHLYRRPAFPMSDLSSAEISNSEEKRGG
jgi:hypothetical protein